MRWATVIAVAAIGIAAAVSGDSRGGSRGTGDRAAQSSSNDGPLELDRESGFFGESFSVGASVTPAGCIVRYTTNGTSPSPRVGSVLESPVLVTNSTVLRAAAFRGDEQVGTSVSRTFIFPNRVAEQPSAPAGYPRRFLSRRRRTVKTFDYAMDPEVLKRHGDELPQVLQDLPTLSIAIAPAHFADLYENHSERGGEWERPAFVELLYPARKEYEGFPGFRIECGLRMHGGLAVDQARKKSFRLLFKGQYGNTKLRYPIFESAVHHSRTAARTFDTLILRAAGNTNWSKDDAWKHAPSTYLRDQFVRDTQLAMSGVGARGTFAHLYVNGLYFGVYNICERPDTRFLASYFGGDESDYTAVNHGGVVDGNHQLWSVTERLLRGGGSRRTGPAPTQQNLAGSRLVDFASFADYLLLNWCAGTGDWPYNNWYAGLRNRGDAKLRFFAWDAEYSLWTIEGYLNSNPGAWVNPYFLGRRRGRTIVDLWQHLRLDPEFRLVFADRIQAHLFGDGALTDGRMIARFAKLADLLDRPIVAESARWGDAALGNEDSPRTREKDWIPSRDAVFDILDGNAARFLAALRTHDLLPPTAAPEFVRTGDSIRFRVPAEIEVYYTLTGRDPRARGGDVVEGARRADTSGVISLPQAARLAARARSSGGEWSPLVDEVFLPSGMTLPLRITELYFDPVGGEATEFIEIVNGGAFRVPLTGVHLRGVDYRFAPGAELEPGAVVVLAPDDDPAAFASAHPGAPVYGSYRGHLDNSGEELTIVDRSGVAIDSVVFGAGVPWPKEAAGGGYSLVRRDRSKPAREPMDWRVSENVGGTPGR